MIGLLAGIAVKLIPGLAGQVFSHLEKKADTDTERLRIQKVAEQHGMSVQADVIKAGMQFWPFWVAWSLAAFPLCGWLGWGYLDSAFNGALPDVATLPPQLKAYADVILANIFYSGAGMGAAQVISRAIAVRK